MTAWVTVRQLLSLVILTFSLSLGVLSLFGNNTTDWEVAVSEWMAVWATELYIVTFYWDLGDEYYIEQVRRISGGKLKTRTNIN